MTIRFDQRGGARKEFVKAICVIVGVESKYLGAPTMAYRIGDITVTKNGDIETADDFDSSELVSALKQRGFCPVTGENEDGGEIIEQEEQAPQNANNVLVIEMPKQSANEQNLRNILAAKGELIKKALGVSGLPIETTEETIKFPWFERILEPDEVKAYTKFIAALCKLSSELKRTSAEPKEIVNEKYAFRCFLLRLGFIGESFKEDRKILLKRLNGSSAFKGGVKSDQTGN